MATKSTSTPANKQIRSHTHAKKQKKRINTEYEHTYYVEGNEEPKRQKNDEPKKGEI